MVIELRRGEVGEVVLNNLYAQTQLQSSFGINMVALDKGQPKLMHLKQILEAFIDHRREVVTRRTLFDLRKARERTHVLEGLAVALSSIDPIIAMIKASANPSEARLQLISTVWQAGVVSGMLEKAGATATRPDDLGDEFGLKDDGYHLSPVQAQAILDLKLHRLTGLEQDKIVDEYSVLLEKITDLLDILQNPDRLKQVVRDELIEIKENYGDERRTEIYQDASDLTVEDLINEEDVVVTLSHEGYAKAQPLSDYKAQKRGGRGKTATKMKDEDFIDKLFVASTHDTLLFFSSNGKVYWKKVYELPIGGRAARGKPIVNLLPLEGDERINAVLPIREFDKDQFVFMATENGTVKRTSLEDFSRPRANGIIALDIREGDTLIDVALTDGECDIMLFSNSGKAIRFKENDVRQMGRTAAGVRGIKLQEDQKMVGLIVVEEGDILSVTENGYGKRTEADEYPTYGRGGQGVVSIKTSDRNGDVVGAVQVTEDNEIMLISDGGVLVRTPVGDISVMSRNTQGVRLIRLAEDEKLVELERIANLGGEDEELEEGDVDQEENSDAPEQASDESENDSEA
jgi:DNA gyrase subunit A